jgi:hypothetical protein
LPPKRTPARPTLNVGITGHRANTLPPEIIDSLEAVVDEVFRELRVAALRVQKTDPKIPDREPAKLTLHTPLATGADQLAAKVAHGAGYHVRALLPFDPDEYRNDFSGEEIDDYDKALDAAHEIFALPGDRADAIGAYVLVGTVMVDEADILVAVWDGDEGHGPGGTAHVVDLALANSVPIIHIAIDREGANVTTRLLVGGHALEPIIQSLESGSLDGLLRGTLRPKPAPAAKPKPRPAGRTRKTRTASAKTA